MLTRLAENALPGRKRLEPRLRVVPTLGPGAAAGVIEDGISDRTLIDLLVCSLLWCGGGEGAG